MAQLGKILAKLRQERRLTKEQLPLVHKNGAVFPWRSTAPFVLFSLQYPVQIGGTSPIFPVSGPLFDPS